MEASTSALDYTHKINYTFDQPNLKYGIQRVYPTEGDFDVAKVLARSLGPREDLHQFGSEV
jgi:uncharacterized protein (UPF0254 family)